MVLKYREFQVFVTLKDLRKQNQVNDLRNHA